MSRYIDADVIDKKVSDAYDTWTDDTAEHVVARNLLKSTRKFLLELPTIDIVFCKECKHRPVKEDADGENYGFNIIAPEGSSLCPCLVDDGWYSWMPKDNFFCGYGKREDE